ERMDRLYVERCSRKLDEMEARAMDEIAKFAGRESIRPYVGVSWGKDSVVVAHLAWRTGLDLPLAWARVEPGANPDCEPVRDTFLARFSVRYHEVIAPRIDGDDDLTLVSALCWKLAAEAAGTERHVIGVRAEESSTRRMSIGASGLSTLRSC